MMFARVKSSRGAGLLVDLLMIVVGINIALWFEGLAEDMQEAETEQVYLTGLRNDLQTDIGLLDEVISENQARVESLEAIVPTLRHLLELTPGEQAGTIFTPSSYFFFQPADFTYTSMQESGDFRLLSNPATKEGLLRLVRHYRNIDTLQLNFIQAMDDEYIPLMMARFDLLEGRITDPSLVSDMVFLNFFPYTLQDTNMRVSAYRQAREMAQAVLELIEGEIKQS